MIAFGRGVSLFIVSPWKPTPSASPNPLWRVATYDSFLHENSLAVAAALLPAFGLLQAIRPIPALRPFQARMADHGDSESRRSFKATSNDLPAKNARLGSQELIGGDVQIRSTLKRAASCVVIRPGQARNHRALSNVVVPSPIPQRASTLQDRVHFSGFPPAELN